VRQQPQAQQQLVPGSDRKRPVSSSICFARYMTVLRWQYSASVACLTGGSLTEVLTTDIGDTDIAAADWAPGGPSRLEESRP
jgi:hypothetical protein